MKIDEKQIPPEVIKKVRALVLEMGFFGTPIRDVEAREIAVAVLSAWPGAERSKHYSGQGRPGVRCISLPLLQEARAALGEQG